MEEKKVRRRGRRGEGEVARGGRRRPNRSKAWCFTINNPTEDDIKDILRLVDGQSYVFQKEMGELETPHLQGVVQFKNAREFNALKTAVGRAHWEKCKNFAASKRYCCKAEGRLEGPWHSPDCNVRDLQPIVLTCKWQREVVRFVQDTEPDPRTITWFVDEIGGAGKSRLCQYLYRYNGAAYITGGRAQDIKYALSEFIEKNGYPAVVLFDFPRTLEGHVSYTAIEEIRNGFWFSTKYESRTTEMPPAHFLCFANWEPDITKLSADRWHIIRLGNGFRRRQRRRREVIDLTNCEETDSGTDVDEPEAM